MDTPPPSGAELASAPPGPPAPKPLSDITSKIAAFVLYLGATVPISVGLAHAGAPCSFY